MISVLALMLCLFAFPVLLSFITFLTHRKIMQDARLMSSETYAMQRRLTLMLLAQVKGSSSNYLNISDTVTRNHDRSTISVPRYWNCHSFQLT